MVHRCAWCQEETAVVVKIVNRDLTSSQEHELVCPTCAELEASERTALWNMPLFTCSYGKRRRMARVA